MFDYSVFAIIVLTGFVFINVSLKKVYKLEKHG